MESVQALRNRRRLPCYSSFRSPYTHSFAGFAFACSLIFLVSTALQMDARSFRSACPGCGGQSRNPRLDGGVVLGALQCTSGKMFIMIIMVFIGVRSYQVGAERNSQRSGRRGRSNCQMRMDEGQALETEGPQLVDRSNEETLQEEESNTASLSTVECRRQTSVDVLEKKLGRSPESRFMVIDIAFKVNERQNLLTLTCYSTDDLFASSSPKLAVPVPEHFGGVHLFLTSTTLQDAVNRKPVNQNHFLLLEGENRVVMETDIEPINDASAASWCLLLSICTQGITVTKTICLHGDRVKVLD